MKQVSSVDKELYSMKHHSGSSLTGMEDILDHPSSSSGVTASVSAAVPGFTFQSAQHQSRRSRRHRRGSDSMSTKSSESKSGSQSKSRHSSRNSASLAKLAMSVCDDVSAQATLSATDEDSERLDSSALPALIPAVAVMTSSSSVPTASSSTVPTMPPRLVTHSSLGSRGTGASSSSSSSSRGGRASEHRKGKSSKRWSLAAPTLTAVASSSDGRRGPKTSKQSSAPRSGRREGSMSHSVTVSGMPAISQSLDSISLSMSLSGFSLLQSAGISRHIGDGTSLAVVALDLDRTLIRSVKSFYKKNPYPWFTECEGYFHFTLSGNSLSATDVFFDDLGHSSEELREVPESDDGGSRDGSVTPMATPKKRVIMGDSEGGRSDSTTIDSDHHHSSDPLDDGFVLDSSDDHRRGQQRRGERRREEDEYSWEVLADHIVESHPTEEEKSVSSSSSSSDLSTSLSDSEGSENNEEDDDDVGRGSLAAGSELSASHRTYHSQASLPGGRSSSPTRRKGRKRKRMATKVKRHSEDGLSRPFRMEASSDDSSAADSSGAEERSRRGRRSKRRSRHGRVIHYHVYIRPGVARLLSYLHGLQEMNGIKIVISTMAVSDYVRRVLKGLRKHCGADSTPVFDATICRSDWRCLPGSSPVAPTSVADSSVSSTIVSSAVAAHASAVPSGSSSHSTPSIPAAISSASSSHPSSSLSLSSKSSSPSESAAMSSTVIPGSLTSSSSSSISKSDPFGKPYKSVRRIAEIVECKMKRALSTQIAMLQRAMTREDSATMSASAVVSPQRGTLTRMTSMSDVSSTGASSGAVVATMTHTGRSLSLSKKLAIDLDMDIYDDCILPSVGESDVLNTDATDDPFYSRNSSMHGPVPPDEMAVSHSREGSVDLSNIDGLDLPSIKNRQILVIDDDLGYFSPSDRMGGCVYRIEAWDGPLKPSFKKMASSSSSQRGGSGSTSTSSTSTTTSTTTTMTTGVFTPGGPEMTLETATEEEPPNDLEYVAEMISVIQFNLSMKKSPTAFLMRTMRDIYESEYTAKGYWCVSNARMMSGNLKNNCKKMEKAARKGRKNLLHLMVKNIGLDITEKQTLGVFWMFDTYLANVLQGQHLPLTTNPLCELFFSCLVVYFLIEWAVYPSQHLSVFPTQPLVSPLFPVADDHVYLADGVSSSSLLLTKDHGRSIDSVSAESLSCSMESSPETKSFGGSGSSSTVAGSGSSSSSSGGSGSGSASSSVGSGAPPKSSSGGLFASFFSFTSLVPGSAASTSVRRASSDSGKSQSPPHQPPPPSDPAPLHARIRAAMFATDRRESKETSSTEESSEKWNIVDLMSFGPLSSTTEDRSGSSTAVPSAGSSASSSPKKTTEDRSSSECESSTGTTKGSVGSHKSDEQSASLPSLTAGMECWKALLRVFLPHYVKMVKLMKLRVLDESWLGQLEMELVHSCVNVLNELFSMHTVCFPLTGILDDSLSEVSKHSRGKSRGSKSKGSSHTMADGKRGEKESAHGRGGGSKSRSKSKSKGGKNSSLDHVKYVQKYVDTVQKMYRSIRNL